MRFAYTEVYRRFESYRGYQIWGDTWLIDVKNAGSLFHNGRAPPPLYKENAGGAPQREQGNAGLAGSRTFMNPRGVGSGWLPLNTWKKMKIDRRCQECVYWEREKGVSGKCHRMPPAVSYNGDDVVSRFPRIRENNWCGEWLCAAEYIEQNPNA